MSPTAQKAVAKQTTATTKTTTAKKAKKAAAKAESGVFSAEEKAAMKARAKEARAAKRGDADPGADVLARIAQMADGDRVIAEKLHAAITTAAPSLKPRLWYGMPAYAKDGKVLCNFQDAAKFKTRYATFGFSDPASLDDGVMWPVAFALLEWTPAVEEEIVRLVKKAVG